VFHTSPFILSMEFSEGTDVDVEEDYVEIGDIEFSDDDPVQCWSVFCVIYNEPATEPSRRFRYFSATEPSRVAVCT